MGVNRQGAQQVPLQPFRSDNSVKNHYHSRLRKALRRINSTIADMFSRNCRPFKTSLLSRVVQTAENSYR